jgi:hypothetical protein
MILSLSKRAAQGSRTYVKYATAATSVISPRCAGIRSYHSYPDPSEKPAIATTKAEVSEKKYDKTSSEFKLDPKYNMKILFPGVKESDGIGSLPPPPTLFTTLPSGLTVASQDVPGMMTSMTFAVRAGRYVYFYDFSCFSTNIAIFVLLFALFSCFDIVPMRTKLQVTQQLERLIF